MLDLVHEGNYATVSKDRTGIFSGDPKPITVETGKRLAEWLAKAEPSPATKPERVQRPAAAPNDGEPPLFEVVSGHIAACRDVRALGRMGDRVDVLASEGQLTADEATRLEHMIKARHDEIEPAVGATT